MQRQRQVDGYPTPRTRGHLSVVPDLPEVALEGADADLMTFVVPLSSGPPCSCSHGRTAHDHHRQGSDCALCACTRYHRSHLPGLALLRG